MSRTRKTVKAMAAFLLAAVCAAAVLCLGGCRTKEEAAFARKLARSERMKPDTINTVTVGSVVSIALDENQSVPYRWSPVISDDSLIELIHDKVDSSKVKSNAPGSPGAVHIYYFEALRPGECIISMNWADIREDEIDRTVSYTVAITE